MRKENLVFISHKEEDFIIADCLVDFILCSIHLSDEEVRCTSVEGHQLPFDGKSIEQKLKEDLNVSAVLIALLTRDSIRSTWVLFELGAAWASNRTIVQLLSPDLTYDDLPGPLKDYPSISIADDNCDSRLMDVIKGIAKQFNVKEKTGGKPQAKLQKFIKTFRRLTSTSSSRDFCSLGINAINAIASSNLNEWSKQDISDLFIVLFKANRCWDANKWLRNIPYLPKDTNPSDYAVVEYVYDLYGSYDLLVKIRAHDRDVVRTLFRPLLPEMEGGTGGGAALCKSMTVVDVSEEKYLHGFELEVSNNNGIVAFIKFNDVKDSKDANAVIARCQEGEKAAVLAMGSKCVALKSVFRDRESEAFIAEYFLGCGGYYALNKITLTIESEIEKYAGNGPQKETLLAQSIWKQPNM